MAAANNIVDFETLLEQVNDDYFNLGTREVDSEDENSDWTSACGNDRDLELDFAEEESESTSEVVVTIIKKKHPVTLTVSDAATTSSTSSGDDATATSSTAAAGDAIIPNVLSTPVAGDAGDAALLNVQTEGPAGDDVLPRTKRQNYLSKFKCPCKSNCISKFNLDTLLGQLVYYESLTSAEKDMLVLGKISVTLHTSSSVGPQSKHKQKQRERTRCEFKHEGRPMLICHVGWYNN